MGVERLNAMNRESLRETFLSCCQAGSWVRMMLDNAPFISGADLLSKADLNWERQSKEDILEAVSGHPAIGHKSSHRFSMREQESALSSADSVKKDLEGLNQRYFEKFGFTFIIFASDKTGPEITDVLRQRLLNSKDQELEIAAGELKKINALRLKKILQENSP